MNYARIFTLRSAFLSGAFLVCSLFGGFASAENTGSHEVLSGDASSAALTFEECYQLALKQSEGLKIRTEDIRVAESNYRNAVGRLLPNIHAISSERIRSNQNFGFSSGAGNSSNGSTDNGNTDGNGTGGNTSGTFRSSNKNQFEGYINLRQPLFSGFRDIILTQALKSDIKAVEFDRQRAAQQLYLAVSEVYHQVIMYQNDLVVLRKTEDVLNERIKDLGEFIKLGKSRESEVLAAQSDIASVQASRDQLQGLLGASREMLAFLTGLPSSALVLKLSPMPAVNLPLDQYLVQAGERFDLQAAGQRLISAEKQATAAERAHWPQISLEGNYYPYDDPDLNREWDMLFKLDLPLFEGGSIEAQAEAQRARARASSLSLAEGKRIAERDVRTAFSNLEAAVAETKSLRSLAQASQKNFESQRADYKNGVVTNLDVLAAIRLMQDARRRLLDSETNVRANLVKLQVAAGAVPL